MPGNQTKIPGGQQEIDGRQLLVISADNCHRAGFSGLPGDQTLALQGMHVIIGAVDGHAEMIGYFTNCRRKIMSRTIAGDKSQNRFLAMRGLEHAGICIRLGNICLVRGVGCIAKSGNMFPSRISSLASDLA